MHFHPRDTKFKALIKAAQHVSTTYLPPSRKDVGGKLLKENYDQYMTETIACLLTDADVFGLTVLGDGATICKHPLTNVLFAGKSSIMFVTILL